MLTPSLTYDGAGLGNLRGGVATPLAQAGSVLTAGGGLV
jgi:hypothetical protein